MSAVVLDRTLHATVDDVPALVQAAGAAAREAGLAEAQAMHVELAVEEAVTNICSHTYGGEEGRLWLEVRADADTVTVELMDEGEAFNPLEAEEPDLQTDLAHRRIGGLGVHLIRNVTDHAAYERRAERNVLTMVFRRKG